MSQVPYMESFKNYFEKLSLDCGNNTEIESYVAETIDQLLKNTCCKINDGNLDKPVVEAEVVNVLSKLQNGKAYGRDRITQGRIGPSGQRANAQWAATFVVRVSDL